MYESSTNACFFVNDRLNDNSTNSQLSYRNKTLSLWESRSYTCKFEYIITTIMSLRLVRIVHLYACLLIGLFWDWR